MRRILAILFALTLVFALVACSNEKDTTSEPDTSTIQSEPESTNNTVTTDGDTTDESSSDTETLSNSTETSKPSQNEPPSMHTHNFSSATCTEPKKCSCGVTDGQALGHKWQEATCKTPKTCNVCKVTKGNVAEHKYDKFVCTICGFKDEEGIAIATNPRLSFKPNLYTTECSKDYLYDVGMSVSNIIIDNDIYISTYMYWSFNFINSSEFPSKEISKDEILSQEDYIIYDNNKYYLYTGQGGPYEDCHYELTDKYVIIYENSKLILKCILNLDGTLTIVESNHTWFKRGTILKNKHNFYYSVHSNAVIISQSSYPGECKFKVQCEDCGSLSTKEYTCNGYNPYQQFASYTCKNCGKVTCGYISCVPRAIND